MAFSPADIMASPVGLNLLDCFSLGDLTAFQAASKSFDALLNQPATQETWASAVSGAARKTLLGVPAEALSEMEPREQKAACRSLRRACMVGSLEGPVALSKKEFQDVLAYCQTAEEKGDGVLLGRLFFDEDDLEAVLDMEEDPELPAEDQVLCFSSDISFAWPGAKNSKMSLSVGFREGSSAVELCGETGTTLSLQLDLLGLKTESLGVPEIASGDLACCNSSVDITDAATRSFLSSEKGVLCAVGIREHEAKVCKTRVVSTRKN